MVVLSEPREDGAPCAWSDAVEYAHEEAVRVLVGNWRSEVTDHRVLLMPDGKPITLVKDVWGAWVLRGAAAVVEPSLRALQGALEARSWVAADDGETYAIVSLGAARLRANRAEVDIDVRLVRWVPIRPFRG
ncbi:hypothetical protein WMF01_12220 [Sorangium sp. So ce1667]